MNEDVDRIPEIALKWVRDGRTVALATVIQTWGSAPRPVGSQLVISDEAAMMGSVSGGCVEGAVVEEALDSFADGTPRLLTYGVTDDEAFAVGLACGGTIRVLVEPVGGQSGLNPEVLEALVAARAAGTPTIYAVNLSTWERRLEAGGTLDADGMAALAGDRATLVERGGDEWFLGVHNPPLRLFIIGGVHIAQPLSRMAAMAGYDVTIIDPREAFASAARFPQTRLIHDWPDEALQAAALDTRSAVVTLTHDPKLDDPAIRTALSSPIFYLGCLGSTRTHAKRVARLEEAGFTAAQIARIHAPVGADIGGRAPAEIAVSIMAQITERLRRPQTRPAA